MGGTRWISCSGPLRRKGTFGSLARWSWGRPRSCRGAGPSPKSAASRCTRTTLWKWRSMRGPRSSMPPRTPTGDWTNGTWFLHPAHGEHLWSMRYERAELEDAHPALSDLYPSDFCQKCFRELEQAGQPEDHTDRAIRDVRQIRRLAGIVLGLYEPHAIVPA